MTQQSAPMPERDVPTVTSEMREWALVVADKRMRVLIDYAVEVWGPESDVDPEADNGSMRADLETFLDVEVRDARA